MTHLQLTEFALRVVEQAQRELPAALHTLALAVPVHYEYAPNDELMADGFEPDILGLFSGSPHGSDYNEYQPMPAQITLYLKNLWDFSDADLAVFQVEVRITYLHELGHYLGWDEDDLAARELD